jgi:FKBP12-rapamycin complex-associated protein
MQQLLNLAEFMEHDDKVLPISMRTLGQYALKCHAYAKALHWKELECMSEPLPETIEALIRINNQLNQPDVAVGILTHAQQTYDMELQEEWYEKLERWEDALSAYERKQQDDPDNFEITVGRMRCLHALGEWESLYLLAQENWGHATPEARRRIAPLAAGAAWGLAQWDTVDDYIAVLKHDSPDRAWFRSILNIHRNQFHKAQQHIDRARTLLDTELTTLVTESYNRAYTYVTSFSLSF